MKRNSILTLMNLVAFIVTVLVNSLANILPLNNKNTGELSDAYPNLFTPAGYVFAIWGVIYLLLLAYSVYQILPRNRGKEFINRIGWFFALSCLANIVWIFLWHYEYVLLSLIPMFTLLISLIMIYTRLDIGNNPVSRDEKLYVHLPFSVYLGWITVAPIANVTAALVSVGWNGFGLGEVMWTSIMILIALVLTLVNLNKRKDIAYASVIVWALGGIISKQMNVYPLPYVAGGAVLLIVAYAITQKRDMF